MDCIGEFIMKKYTISEIDEMDGHTFEFFCAHVLALNGYVRTEVTPSSGDQGIDVIAYKDGIKYGIQCKCYSSDIGNSAVQQAFSGKIYYECHLGVVLTNRYFTSSARELSEKNKILLWDRDCLIDLIKKADIFAENIKSDDSIIIECINIVSDLTNYDLLSDPCYYEKTFNRIVDHIKYNVLWDIHGNRINSDKYIEIRTGHLGPYNPSGVISIQPQKIIEKEEAFLASLERTKKSTVLPKFYYVENRTCWQCTCGTPNAITSFRCSKCDRSRTVVKTLFEAEWIEKAYNNYLNLKERNNAAILEKEYVVSDDNPQKNDVELLDNIPKNIEPVNHSINKRSILGKIIVGMVIICLCVFAGYVFLNNRVGENPNEDKSVTVSGLENKEDPISQTKESISRYVNILGASIPDDGNLTASQRFLDNLDRVYVMGKIGSIEFSYSNNVVDTVHWKSYGSETQDKYLIFIDDMKKYCKSDTVVSELDNELQIEALQWKDPYFDLEMKMWFDQGTINISWQLSDGEKNIIRETNIENIIDHSKESLEPYIRMIGKDASTSSTSASQSFLDGMDNVFVMGKTGRIEHSFSKNSGGVITIMDWISNDTFEEENYYSFIRILNRYFNDIATLSYNENVMNKDYWAWHITNDELWPICFEDNGRIIIRWYDKTIVDVPGEEQ